MAEVKVSTDATVTLDLKTFGWYNLVTRFGTTEITIYSIYLV